jgi:hypothetical protein
MPVRKGAEANLMLAMAAANGCKVMKTVKQQVFLYDDMGDDVAYIRPPYLPEPAI